ncbi:MAG: Uma2 family endonuclease [Bacteroidota bacterium]
MQAEAIQKKASAKSIPSVTNGTEIKLITWEEFEREYLSREDKYKYEWVDGMVEKTTRMDQTQLYIQINLQACFEQLKFKGNVGGWLVAEPALFFLANYRHPDFAWFTDEQIDNLAEKSARDVPAFVIEVISSNDRINPVKLKLENYRQAGVQVVWHIFPKLRQVDVYSGDKLNKMEVKSGEEICSAAPAVPGFSVAVNEIFKRKIKPS